MCGIVGVWSPEPVAPPEEMRRRLQAMAAMIRHRGPDDLQVWSDGRLGLGFSRLAVLDLSDHARQPMHDPETGNRLVFNGEIYNFAELRAELAAQGIACRSQGDSETILLGYRLWGEAVVERLRGMFAFALWDARAGRLFLARDRAGQKPLFHARVGQTLLFASEIKALAAWPEFQRKPDPVALGHYFSFQAVPAPLSAFKGVAALPPAHSLTLEPNGRTRCQRYWALPRPEEGRQVRAADAEAELAARLAETVKSQMVSDVPLGAFLSGGIDSAAILAEMQQGAERPVETFTLGFEEASHDERAPAALVARHLGSDHHAEVLRPEAVDCLPALAWHYDQPFADPSALPTYLLSRFAAERVKVVLSGDGGDELLLGYPRYLACRLTRFSDRLPRPLLGLAAAAGRRLGLEAHGNTGARRLGRFLADLEAAPLERYLAWVGFLPEREKAEAFGEALRPALADNPSRLLAGWFDGAELPEAAAARADFHHYLPDVILTKVDIASMAHGLEARAPFLDHELAGWIAALPTGLKLQGWRGKALLRGALAGRLPPETLQRRKRGFGLPLAGWLAGPLREPLQDLVLSPQTRQRGLIAPAYAERLVSEHLAGRRDHAHRLWALMMLEAWLRTWIDPATPPAAPGV